MKSLWLLILLSILGNTQYGQYLLPTDSFEFPITKDFVPLPAYSLFTGNKIVMFDLFNCRFRHIESGEYLNFDYNFSKPKPHSFTGFQYNEILALFKKHELWYVATPYRMLVFDLEGNFIKQVKYKLGKGNMTTEWGYILGGSNKGIVIDTASWTVILPFHRFNYLNKYYNKYPAYVNELKEEGVAGIMTFNPEKMRFEHLKIIKGISPYYLAYPNLLAFNENSLAFDSENKELYVGNLLDPWIRIFNMEGELVDSINVQAKSDYFEINIDTTSAYFWAARARSYLLTSYYDKIYFVNGYHKLLRFYKLGLSTEELSNLSGSFNDLVYEKRQFIQVIDPLTEKYREFELPKHIKFEFVKDGKVYFSKKPDKVENVLFYTFTLSEIFSR